MHPPLRNNVLHLLEKDRLKEALGLLKEYSFLLNKQTRIKIAMLAGRQVQLNKQESFGTISTEEINRERNRIREALLTLTEDISVAIELSPDLLKKQKIKRLLTFGWIALYGLTSISLLWYVLQAQQQFRIEGRLLVDRASFRHLEGTYEWGSMAVNSLHLYNYQNLNARGDKVKLDEQMNQVWKKEINFPSGSLHLTANPEIPGISINLGPVKVERLPITPGSLITLISPKKPGDPLKLQIQQETPLQIHLNYADSLDIIAEQARLEVSEFDQYVTGPVRLRLYTPEGVAREITCATFAGMLALDLYLKDTVALQSQGLLISQPTFYEPMDQVAVPTILGGKLLIREQGNEPLETITFETGSALNIIGASALSLDRLSLDRNGIFLSFQGIVSALETGRNEESRNPSRIKWIWHNHKWPLTGITILLLGLFALVMIFLRR